MTVLYGQDLDTRQFEQYTTASGMSGNNITGIGQDAAGYVWISTTSGLNRFNGYRFVQYHEGSDNFSLASEELSGITWLGKDQLAVYTAGLHIIDTKTGNRSNLFIPYHRRQFEYKFNMVESAAADEEGNIYVVSRSGFYHFNKNRQLVSRFDYYTEAQVPVDHFFFARELLRLDQARWLIISIDGLYLYDSRARKIKKMVAGDCPLLAEFLRYPASFYLFRAISPGNLLVVNTGNGMVTHIDIQRNRKTTSRLPVKNMSNDLNYRSKLFPVSDTLFYLTGHSTGFYKVHFSPATGKVMIDPRQYFSNHQCNAIFSDAEKNLWVGTTNGLFRQDEAHAHVQVSQLPPQVLAKFPNIIISEILEEKDHIYVATRSPGKLLVFNKETMELDERLTILAEKNYPSGRSIYTIAEADAATLVLGTNGPLYFMQKSTMKADTVTPPHGWDKTRDWCASLAKDSKDNLWISSELVHVYNMRSKKYSFIPPVIQHAAQIEVPQAMCEDGSGNIWMAAHGLSRYNPSMRRFDMRIDSFPFIKMADKQVNVIAIEKDRDIIWFNSRNNGLISYNVKDKTFRHFTSADGLPQNNITALLVVKNKLWIACTTGIAYLDLATSKITGFGTESGFPDMPVTTGTNFTYDSITGRISIGFSKAVVRFDPNSLLRKRTPPRVFLEDITLHDQHTQFLPPSVISTSWKENYASISIGAINFSNAASQQFAYRVADNAAAPWIDLGKQNTFSLLGIGPGRHAIQVKAYSATNSWPEQVKEMILVVEPPLWRKAWFIITASLLGAGLLALFVRWRSGIARKKEMEKTHIEKLKADDYKNQFELEQISNYFSSSLAGKKSEDEVLWDVAANLIGRMNYEDCIIYTWNNDRSKMIQRAAYGPKGKPGVISANVFEVIPGQGIVGHVIETMRPVLITDTRTDSRYRVDDKFRLSEVAVPIIHNDELVGVIDSEHSMAGYFSERDIKILTTIATLIGNKLKQIESDNKLELKKRELAGINEQLAEARLNALQCQMNPHFVFNALNSIKRMILEAENEKASRYLSKFASMIRMTLEHSKETFVSIDNHIEYLEAYLEMEKLRFEDSFSYSISVDEEVDTAAVVLPSLMIQPVVENAIWHGLMHSPRDKKIGLSFNREDDKIICIVEDNGIGIHFSEQQKSVQRPLHRSMGLENLRKRLKIINDKYNISSSMEISDLNNEGTGTGTRVMFRFNTIEQ